MPGPRVPVNLHVISILFFTKCYLENLGLPLLISRGIYVLIEGWVEFAAM